MSEYPEFYEIDESNEGDASFTPAEAEDGQDEDEDEGGLNSNELQSLSDTLIELLDTVYDTDLLDPLLYIQAQITQMVDNSSASEHIKNSVDAKTPIIVSYRPKPPDGNGLVGSDFLISAIDVSTGHREERTFTLDEIVTDSYLRTLEGDAELQIHWPTDYPSDLIEAFESANLQQSYKADVERQLNTPKARLVLEVQARADVQNRLSHFSARHPNIPEPYKQLMQAYERDEATLKTVEFRTRTWKGDVAQALYLCFPNDKSSDALLIFLDAKEEEAVFPLPHTHRRRVIETSGHLGRLVTERLSLYKQLRKNSTRLTYWTTLIGPYPTTLPPLFFRETEDAFAALHTIRIKRMLSDIDTLVSTEDERLADQWLQAGVFILQGLSIVASLPMGPGGLGVRLLVSFLLGCGAAALNAVRGASADSPEEADEHYRTALYGLIAEIVGPLATKLLGKTISAVSKAKLTRTVYRHMSRTRTLSIKKNPGYTKIKPTPAAVKSTKRDVVSRLSEGPQQAQILADKNSVLVEKMVEGHELTIYRGRVFRGDMRPPEEIFEEGFKLRTPAAEIQQDIHKVTGVRGGFGGGHDALDPDGKGISTSVYYYKDNVGAYVYGGKKGGYTYLIDARKFDGYHLYQNHHNAQYPHARNKIRFQPTEINYGHDIPSASVLGAYDAAGEFIPNNTALRVYARELAIKEIQRLAQVTASAGAKLTESETPLETEDH